jgi:tetratricopeptide (TPR) repeat protein
METLKGTDLMKKAFWCVAITMSLLSLSCSTSWNSYAANMFHGKQLLREQDYAEARTDFVNAADAQKRPAAFSFAATASYKMGDLPSAERYVMEAERLDGRDYSYVRTLGYKSLVLLSEGKNEEGLATLSQYAQVLATISSPMGAGQIENVTRQKPVDLAALEKLVDEQAGRYESDIEQFQTTGTGFYDRPRMLGR